MIPLYLPEQELAADKNMIDDVMRYVRQASRIARCGSSVDHVLVCSEFLLREIQRYIRFRPAKSQRRDPGLREDVFAFERAFPANHPAPPRPRWWLG